MTRQNSSPAVAAHVKPRSSLVKRAVRAAGAVALTLYFLFIAVILLLRYVVLPHVTDYRGDIERLAGANLKTKVSIGAIAADWDGLRPRLSLSDVRVFDKAGTVALNLPQTEATLSWDSLLTFEVRLHRLEIDDANLDIKRLPDGVIMVGGIAIDTQAGPSGGGMTDWLLDQRRIVIRGGTLTWTDQMRKAPKLTFSQAYLLISRFGIRHHFALSFTPPPDMASPLDIRGYFDHSLFSDQANSDAWSGESYLKVDYVDLAAWNSFVDLPIKLASGSGALRAWLKFQPLEDRSGRVTRLPQLVADIRLANVVTRVAPDLPELTLAHLGGRITATQAEHQDALKLIDVRIEAGAGQVFDATNLDAQRELDAKGQEHGGQVHADSLTLDTLSAIGQSLPVGKEVRAKLVELAPRGELQHLTYKWAGALEQPLHYQLGTAFKGLSVRGQAPPAGDTEVSDGTTGFKNLDGSLNASDTAGTLVINAHDAALDVPALFEHADIPAATLDARATWQLVDHDLTVRIDHADLANSEINASIAGTYKHGPNSGSRGPGYVDFSGHLDLSDVHQLARYMPLTIGADARSYLAKALISGTAEDGSYVVRGPMERFPFRAASKTDTPAASDERFRIETNLHNVTLDYAPTAGETAGARAPGAPPSWPVFSGVEGSIVLDRDQMSSEVKSGHLEGANVSKMTVAVSDVGDRKAAVKLSAEIDGAAQNYVHFINESPVGDWLSHFTDKTQTSGDAHMHIDMLLPLADLNKTTVSGKLSMSGNQVTLFDWLPQMSDVKGELGFTESSLTLKGINGKFLGGDIKLDASTAPDHVLEIRGGGTMVSTGLAKVPEFPFIERLEPHLHGTTSYRVALNLAAFGATDATALNHGPRVAVDSSLEGIAIDLPEPAQKDAATSLPLSITINPQRDNLVKGRDQIELHLGSIFNATFAREANSNGDVQIVRTAYGVNTPAVLTQARVNANLIAKTLDVDAWRDALDSMTTHATASNPLTSQSEHIVTTNPFVPEAVTARVDDAKIIDKHFEKVGLTATHANSTWTMALTSNEVVGRVLWRDIAGVGDAQQDRVTARLDKLIVPETAAQGVNQLLEPNRDSTTELPALDVIADDFELSGKKFGRLELLAANVTNGNHHIWRLDKLNLTNPDATLQAKGTWGTDANGADVTRMTLDLNAKNVGGMLDRLALPDTVKDGTATMTGNIVWQGTPLAIDFASLNGDLTLDVGRGQFLKVDPGIGKLLGVLSLQSMQRRLTFDFNDVFASGFAFDSIKAKATIKNGVATSQDFEMRGASAVVQMDGSADLVHETQTLHVKVLPQINLGAGSLAYAFLNPAIGLGTLVFQELLRNPISNALAYEYNVTGPWADPVIVRGSVTPRAAPSPENPAVPIAPIDAKPQTEQQGKKPDILLPAGPTPPALIETPLPPPAPLAEPLKPEAQ